MSRHRTNYIVALTGGGSGGHLYPLLAVADEITRQSGGSARIVYLAPPNPANEAFRERGIEVHTIPSSKLRRYLSLQNLIDVPKFFLGFVKSLVVLYAILPDVLFSKGGPGAFPVVLAARFYRIPVMIHESDAVAGLTSRLSVPFAARIGITFPNAAAYFPGERTALVGTPLRSALFAERETIGGAKRALGFDPVEPLLLILGGSQGAARLNTFVIENVTSLLERFQVYHQTGTVNAEEVVRLVGVALEQAPPALRARYHSAEFLSAGEMRRALAAADVALSRAGSSAIAELALFAIPAVLVPLPGAANDHQRKNAYAYADTGVAAVIEEGNLTAHIVMAELSRLFGVSQRRGEVVAAVASFVRPEAARVIAVELLRLGGFVA